MNSLPERAYGIVRRPRATYAVVAAAPAWASVLITSTVITFVCSAGFLQTEVGQQALADQWESTSLAFGQTVDDAQYARMEDTAASRPFRVAYAAGTALVGGPVLAFALSAVLFLVLNRTTGLSSGAAPSGPRVSFAQVLAVVCYAGVILVLRQIIATPLDYMRESTGSPTTLMQFFSMLDEGSPLARFLGVIDFFVLWWIIVLAIGISVLYGLSSRRLALVFTGTYVALALLAALAMAVSGGGTA